MRYRNEVTQSKTAVQISNTPLYSQYGHMYIRGVVAVDI